MRWGSDGPVVAAAAAVLAVCARDASAAGGGIDPSYGRIDGDVAVVFGVGAVVAPRGPRVETELRLRYLETAGFFVTYEDGEVWGSASAPRRALTTGFELRPLFLFRWLKGHELQRARLDLALDSIGLELGTIFDQPAGTGFASRRGVEVGIGIELPILERASGPWIGVRGALRWSEDALASGVVRGAEDRQGILAITLAWHQTLAAHVVDIGDEAVR
jgi:hypothetical protein